MFCFIIYRRLAVLPSEKNNQDMKIEASCILLTVINLPLLLRRSPVKS